jgi:hypothetical protein
MNYQYLKNIKRQCKELCKFAIRINRYAILYVRDLTEEICESFKSYYEGGFKIIENDPIKYVQQCIAKLSADYLQEYPYRLADICNQTEAMCLTALNSTKYHGKCLLKYVHDKNKTQEVQLLAFKKHRKSIKYAINVTEELCLKAINYNNDSFNHVPKEFLTKKLCYTILTQYKGALRYIPEYLQTEAMCIEVVEKNGEYLSYVKIPQTPEMCLAAVKSWGRALQYVETQTPEICLAAVKQYGAALKFVKEQTNEICIEAVKQDGEALCVVKSQTHDICLEAVKRNGIALKYVQNKTYEICLEAVIQNGTALQFVLDEYHTEEISTAAIIKYGKYMEYVKDQFKTEELCLESLKTYYYLTYIPRHLQTKEFYLKAIKISYDVIRDIPTNKITEEMGYYAIENKKAFEYPVKNASEEFYLKMYKLNPDYANKII